MTYTNQTKHTTSTFTNVTKHSSTSTTSFLLRENGDEILKEDGDAILISTTVGGWSPLTKHNG